MRKHSAVIVLAAASALVLAGCAQSDPVGPEDERVRVIASTNVYGSLVEQIGGERVDVTSIITSISQDPHSYEATARDRLAVDGADLIVENGGGYDHFMQVLREGSDAHVITAVKFSHDYPGAEGHDQDDHDDSDDHDHADDDDHHHADGHDHADHNHIEGFNEHIWFDVHTMRHVVEEIVKELSELDPAGSTDFAAAAAALELELTALEDEQALLREEFDGLGVFITEPLPGYLASALGLVDHAPDGFASAVEEGGDVAPATLLAALNAIDSGQIEALLTNAQTGGAETERVEEAARTAGIPIVAFSELLGDDTSYAEWMRTAINDLATALRS